MITLIEVWDAQNLNFVELDEFPYPLNSKLSWEYPIVGQDIPRPFSAGRHNSRKSVDVMTIDCEGEIVENTTSGYWSSRKALVACVLPPLVQPFGVYRHSTIKLKVDGDNTIYFAEVQLASFSIPLAADGSPTVSPFMFSWTCNKGYWTNASTYEAVRL
jgi:hypothetical protein